MEKTPLLLGFAGTQLTPSLAKHLQEVNPAGLVFFARNLETPEQIRRLIKDLKELLGEVILAVDHEGGAVNRFPAGLPSVPSPRALWKTKNASLVQAAAQVQARLLADFGFHLNLAPCLDLYHPQSLVLGNRAFSTHPMEVAAYGLEVLKAHEEVGVAVAGKHFPGHGAVWQDSHVEQAVAEVSKEDLRELHLKPFADLILAGIPAILTSHLVYPALDDLPATLSEKVLTRLLRRNLGFRGLVLSDCLEMAGLPSLTPENLMRRGLAAGLDLMISSFSIKKDLEFQKALAQAARQLYAQHEFPEEFMAIFARFSAFLMRYRPLRKTLPGEDRLEELQLSSICVAKAPERPFTSQGFALVEVGQKAAQGILQDQAAYQVSQDVCKELGTPALQIKLDPADLAPLATAAQQCREQNLTLILVSSLTQRPPDWSQALAALTPPTSSIHLALEQEDDLTGQASLEMAFFSPARGSGKALGRFLKHHLF